MRGVITGILLLIGAAAGAQTDSTAALRLMFWNVENFFDYRDGGTSESDTEFSALGQRHWTRKRFYTKCHAVAKTILWAAGNQGGLPDAIGLAEVENAFVLRRLLQTTVLRKLDYQYLHFESPDRRGIDVALLYRPSRLKLLSTKACHIYNEDSTVLATRDILAAHFLTGDGQDVAILVNHHPSKYGGAAVSESRRSAAVGRLRQLTDSLRMLGIENIIAMGDFNDTPDAAVFNQLDSSLLNLSKPLWEKGLGSIRYEGEWELIDQVFVSPELEGARMHVLQVPFLMVRDSKFAGEKPLRTYSGPRYLGGVSDHCPIWIDSSSLRSSE